MKKGDLIFWTIRDMAVDPNKLIELGFEAYVPRNDYKSAMIKALRVLVKGNEKLYRKDDGETDVTFAVFQQVSSVDGISINREFQFKVVKATGVVSSDQPDWDSFYSGSILKEAYESSKITLNSEQIRSMLAKSIKNEFYGVSIKSRGGVYFVNEANTEAAQKKYGPFFQAFPEDTSLSVMPIHDEKGSMEAIEKATSLEVFSEIEALIAGIEKEVKADTMTTRKLDNDRAEIDKLIEKAKILQSNLQSSLGEVSSRIGNVSTALSKVVVDAKGRIVDPTDFMAMLRGL